MPELEEMENLISSHFYFKPACSSHHIYNQRVPMREIKQPGNRGFSSSNNTRNGTRNFYDLIVEGDDQLLMNEYEHKKDFR